MKRLTLLLLLLALLQPASQAQSFPLPQTTKQAGPQLPDWLLQFSNLPREDREQYLRAFNNAKLAYQQGEWVTCIGYLADCEIIFRHNPNVWNLRACCLMEQRFFEEAEEELQRVLKVQPDDPVTVMNLATLQLALRRFQDSINTLQNLRSMLPYDTQEELLQVLDFREFLCLIMLDRTAEARELVKGLTPISDTPLYYYSQAVFAMVAGNRQEAARMLRIASSIFAKGNILVPYQRALEHSGVADKISSPATGN